MTTDELHELFQQTLQGDYEDEAPWVAVATIRSNGSREVLSIASGWLKENNALGRARAADILAQLRLPSGVPTDEPDWLFRDETYPLIVEMLKRENDPMVLDSGIAALGHLYNPAAIPIIASYAAHSDENVRLSVACALGHFPNASEAVSNLLSLTHDGDSDVRDWAVFGLGVQGDADSPAIRDALIERITDEDEDVREEALVGLSKRRDLRALPILRSHLEAPGLRLRVAEAASAILGLPSDPEEWEAEDYKRALDKTFGAESPDNPRS